jgi:hypothetical protein
VRGPAAVGAQSGTGIALTNLPTELPALYGRAGAIVFIPKDTWIGLQNIGEGHLTSSGVLSAPGYEEYLRAISAPEGKPAVPLSKAELDEIRKKHSHSAI